MVAVCCWVSWRLVANSYIVVVADTIWSSNSKGNKVSIIDSIQKVDASDDKQKCITKKNKN